MLPAELRPREAIDTLVTLFRDELEVVHRRHQLIVRKTERLCADQDVFYCSAVGDYVYDWLKNEVRNPKTGELVELTEAERRILETLLRGMKLGQVEVAAPAALRARPAYLSLQRKLNLPSGPRRGR